MSVLLQPAVVEMPRSTTRVAVSRPVLASPAGAPSVQPGLELVSRELHTSLDAALHEHARALESVFVTRLCERQLWIDMNAGNLRRILSALIGGLLDARGPGVAAISQLQIRTRRCLRGYGAVLEVQDDGPELPRKLLFHLHQMDAYPVRGLPGWELLIARHLAEHHGGRLLAQSPLAHRISGASIRLFLPLSVPPSNTLRSSAHLEVIDVSL